MKYPIQLLSIGIRHAGIPEVHKMRLQAEAKNGIFLMKTGSRRMEKNHDHI
jgi:hypothetical protein